MIHLKTWYQKIAFSLVCLSGFMLFVPNATSQKKDDFGMEQLWYVFSDWKKNTKQKVMWNPEKGERYIVISQSKKYGDLKAEMVDSKINVLFYSKDEYAVWPTPEDKAIAKFIGKLLFAFEAGNSGLVNDILFEHSTEISHNGLSDQKALTSEFIKLKTIEMESINKNVIDDVVHHTVVMKSGKKSYTLDVLNPFGNPVGDMVSRVNQLMEEIDAQKPISLEKIDHTVNWKKQGEKKLEYEQQVYKQFGSPKYLVKKKSKNWEVTIPKRMEEKVLLGSLYPENISLNLPLPKEVTLNVKGFQKSVRNYTGEEFLTLWKNLTAYYEVYLHQFENEDAINPERSMLILKSNDGYYHFVSIKHVRKDNKWEKMEINFYPFIDG